MRQFDAERRAQGMLKIIASDSEVAWLIDLSLDMPALFYKSGEIRLVVLGQDPTVKNPRSRARIKTVLNLDQQGGLRTCLSQVCEGLGLNLDRHIYATNYLKSSERSAFGFRGPDENRLHRILFPFPHQPSIRKRFYSERLKDCTAFARNMFVQPPSARRRQSPP